MNSTCNCHDGLLGEDDYGMPIFCEQCTTGLELALAEIAKRASGWVESKVSYAPAEQSRFWAAMHQHAQRAIDSLFAEYERLDALYEALETTA